MRQKPRGKAAQQPGADLLIDAMNRSMKRFDSYLPVLSDNFGSHRAARSWLVTDQIPLEEAITLLYRAAEGFDLDLAPGHEFPKTIAYFSKKVRASWHVIQRDRQQLKLFPKLEIQVERAVPERKAEPETPAPAPEVETPVLDRDEAIAKFAEDWRAVVPKSSVRL